MPSPLCLPLPRLGPLCSALPFLCLLPAPVPCPQLTDLGSPTGISNLSIQRLQTWIRPPHFLKGPSSSEPEAPWGKIQGLSLILLQVQPWWTWVRGGHSGELYFSKAQVPVCRTAGPSDFRVKDPALPQGLSCASAGSMGCDGVLSAGRSLPRMAEMTHLCPEPPSSTGPDRQTSLAPPPRCPTPPGFPALSLSSRETGLVFPKHKLYFSCLRSLFWPYPPRGTCPTLTLPSLPGLAPELPTPGSSPEPACSEMIPDSHLPRLWGRAGTLRAPPARAP